MVMPAMVFGTVIVSVMGVVRGILCCLRFPVFGIISLCLLHRFRFWLIGVFFTARAQATDFDCEAMIVHRGQIFLFTKEWISAGTTVYTLPASPGNHLARKVSSYPVEGLITGADISADGSMIILCGYSSLIQPFLYVLRDPSGKAFEKGDMFGGSHKRVPLALPYFQVEGIAIKSEEEVFISNEFLRLGSLIQVRQQVHRLQLD